jgi:hypothetical protein
VSGAGRWRRSRSREVASVGGDQSARRCARCRARASCPRRLPAGAGAGSGGLAEMAGGGVRPPHHVVTFVVDGALRATRVTTGSGRRVLRRGAPTVPLGAADDEQHLRVAPAPAACRRHTRPGRHGRRGTARLVADGLLPTAGARRAGGTRSRLDPSRWVGAQSFRAGAARNMPGVGDLFRFSCQRETHRPSSPQREVAGSGATR